MFWVSQHPSSGALKTVSATSGIGHNTGTATSFQRGVLVSACLVIPDGCFCSIQFPFDVLVVVFIVCLFGINHVERK